MDDDISSFNSFEEIEPLPAACQDDEYNNIEKLKALVARSAANGDAATELVEDEVPDICYILQYKGWLGKLSDVHRSQVPINIQLDDLDEPGISTIKKPILEIITKISTWLVRKGRSSNIRPLHSGLRRGDDDNEDVETEAVNQEKTSMVINSVHLINALRAIVGYYPGTSFLGDSVKIDAPYHVLIHHLEDLAYYRSHQPDTHDEEYASITTKHIDVLLSFLEKTFRPVITEEEKRHNSGIPSASFKNLWLILKPGEVIYSMLDGKWTSFVISTIFGGSHPGEERPMPYTIHGWNLCYSGIDGRFRRTTRVFGIDPFSGEQAIANLPIIPARFFRGEDGVSPQDTQAKQIMLGKKAWELYTGPKYRSYEGDLIDLRSSSGWDVLGATGYVSGRVVVDSIGFTKFYCPKQGTHHGQPPHDVLGNDQLPYFAPRCGCAACHNRTDKNEALSAFASFKARDPQKDAAPESDLYYLVLRKVVPGFVLGQRRWAYFDVEHLDEAIADKEAFEHLVLDDKIKLTIQALIGKFASAHGQVSPWPSDFIMNKGQGRIFLLHGSPGVGKTCTAEAIAELTGRPLLSLTSGDLLNPNSHVVERELGYFLKLGERFGAMVLIDEADVFLEARQAQDIERNGLVSVFLRALEYYRGVLFLTTNRVQTFDSAFTSRIHVALHYRALTDANRAKIWLGGFERLERDSGEKVHVCPAARKYVYENVAVRALEWNGREIRNALQTAVALAETEALEDGNEDGLVVVTEEHFRAVVELSRGFKIWTGRDKSKS
ncbi:P-loop containing nucleoside triphosphate hydrolase protein [Hypoxylon fragiforme]|uniref:P-loop containing nucleoside triphosphate hydrolase protein n=1 Tax=Hypoxylon fragiforme TaxID=63214 RepID=UPI0020C6102F|nr:P-loop containing nucleoside triphosphate hydrolase protein [Hypoxylon fragiforme]KAI2604300.1 P-loop containing nucleoside triphosphate hydrolase protein [Hypoxylon fragiforme]